MNSSNQKPLVSIITPTFNRGDFLEKTIQSITSQDYENIEHIVADGGSTDNTVEILKKYEGKYNLRWISEKDQGQADACNKGLKMAKGEIIGFCNSDDYYAKGAIKKIVKVFVENPNIDLVFGACREFDYKTKQLSVIHRSNRPGFWSTTSEDFLYNKETLFQPSLFYSRRIIEKTGPMDISYRIIFESDWWIKMIKNGARILYLDEVLAIIGQHGDRDSVKYAAKGLKEYMNLIKSCGKKVPLKIKISYLRWKYPRIPNLFKKYIITPIKKLR